MLGTDLVEPLVEVVIVRLDLGDVSFELVKSGLSIRVICHGLMPSDFRAEGGLDFCPELFGNLVKASLGGCGWSRKPRRRKCSFFGAATPRATTRFKPGIGGTTRLGSRGLWVEW